MNKFDWIGGADINPKGFPNLFFRHKECVHWLNAYAEKGRLSSFLEDKDFFTVILPTELAVWSDK